MALERDLTRYGFQDFWTTDDRTWWNDDGGRWAVSDVATHEWRHFAGLGHVEASPALTMFPLVHDGAQTLGLGDMLGISSLYANQSEDDWSAARPVRKRTVPGRSLRRALPAAAA